MTTVSLKSPKSQQLTNHVVIALDSSGSMHAVKNAAVDAFNRNLNDLKREAKASGQRTTLTLVIFGNYPPVHVDFVAQPIENVEEMRYSQFTPAGNTPLWDATGRGIEELTKLSDSSLDTVSFLVITITDGQENASLRYTAPTLRNVITSKTATDHWTFAFQVPRGSAKALVNWLGVPSGNVVEWDQTDVGVEEASTANTSGLRSYYQARASGQTSVSNFYTTDLSGVKAKDLKKALVNISSQVKIWVVDKEADITSFVERKNGGVYTTGAGYYQLMKAEKIQYYKQVLIQDKATGKVFAGEEAREMVGLSPSSDRVDGKVTPGNHSNYEIFIQSTSSNRKLPRGTKLAYRLDHTTPSQPTWSANQPKKAGLRTRVTTRSRR